MVDVAKFSGVSVTTVCLLVIAGCSAQAVLADGSAGQTPANVGKPRIVDQYQGAESDANKQTHHFVGLLRAGNGNLIALWRLRPDEMVKVKDGRMTGSVTGPVDMTYYDNDTGYRISTDNGRTWGSQRTLSYGSTDGGTLPDGTVLVPWHRTWWVNEHELRTTFSRTADGGLTWERDENVHVRFPPERTLRHISYNSRLCQMFFWVTTILPLDSKTLIATMQGSFAGLDHSHSILIKSTDAGRSWDFVSCIAGDKKPPHQGYFGTALAVLADKSLLAVIQTEYANPRILVQCRSRDGGRTWTDPIPCPGITALDPSTLHYTTPDGCKASFSGAYQHPKLLRMNNGVLALCYGRPGISVAFSRDGTGRRWDTIKTIIPLGFRYSYSTYDATSGKPAFASIGLDRLLLLYDVYEYAESPKTPRLNTVFSRELKVQRRP